MKLALLFVAVAVLVHQASAFVAKDTSRCTDKVAVSSELQVLKDGVQDLLIGNQSMTRRVFGVSSALATTAALTQQPALAKPNNDDDQTKILKGYDRLSYLLDNWEKETTICGMNDNPYTGNKGCERTPLRVMEFMGYKSINDPLFKADKTLKRLAAFAPAKDQSDYLEALEKWSEAAEEASGMAYISSWGEANPGGGKDRVEYFIERAKKNVTDARDSLGEAIRILSLK